MYSIESGAILTTRELLEKEPYLQSTVKKNVKQYFNMKTNCLKIFSQFTGDTAIHIACRKKDVEVLRLLCEMEAPINIQNVC